MRSRPGVEPRVYFDALARGITSRPPARAHPRSCGSVRYHSTSVNSYFQFDVCNDYHPREQMEGTKNAGSIAQTAMGANRAAMQSACDRVTTRRSKAGPLAQKHPGLLALWGLAITVSQGSSAKFIYFDF